MNPIGKKNRAASARDRLLALAREQGEDFQLVLTRYGLERLLYRLSQSPHHDRFVLKGAMLFILWSRNPHRPTRDVDVLGFGDSSEAGLRAVFRRSVRHARPGRRLHVQPGKRPRRTHPG